MRDVFVDTLVEAANQGHDIHLLTADLGFGLLEKFIEKHPNRYTNVGVSEANMVGIAAGMAMRGKRVFCYSIAPFLIYRALEQIRDDLCAMELPVTIVAVGGGVCYGMEGMTHWAGEDFAIARALPNLKVVAPADPIECRNLTRQMLAMGGPTYLRLGGKTEPAVWPKSADIRFGELSCLRYKGEVAVVANGAMLGRSLAAIEAIQHSKRECRLYSLHTLKPLDEKGLLAISKECAGIISVEEHSKINGMGSAIGEVFSQNGYSGSFRKLALEDVYPAEMGSRDWMRDQHGLSVAAIQRAIVEMCEGTA